jgi:DNA-binding NarL/FixJ family response regulator
LEPGSDTGEYAAPPVILLDVNPVTVVLGNDDSPAREAVRAGLERHGFAVIAIANDADDAVKAAHRHRPSLCLLDADMPGGGIDAAKRIYSELPGTKIAILAGSTQHDRAREAILAGADGYLLRSTAPDRLGAALKGLINGEAALPRSLTGGLVHELRAIERRLEQSANGRTPSRIAAAHAARERRLAAARGAAAAHRSAEARRAAERRRAERPRRGVEAQRSAGLRDVIGARLLYAPRLLRHFGHRLQGGMPVTAAWISARTRMLDYM